MCACVDSFIMCRLIGQLRKVAACEAALERIVLEADEALGSFNNMGRSNSDQVRVSMPFLKFIFVVVVVVVVVV